MFKANSQSDSEDAVEAMRGNFNGLVLAPENNVNHTGCALARLDLNRVLDTNNLIAYFVLSERYF